MPPGVVPSRLPFLGVRGRMNRHVAISVQPPQPSETARPALKIGYHDGPEACVESLSCIMLLHISEGSLACGQRQSGSGGEGPEAMEEVEVVILRFSLAACNPGCLHLVLESMAPKAPYLLKNRTAHPFQYRQAGLGDLPFQPLPAYSAAGFAWQVTKKSYPREVEVQEAYGKQSPQRYPLDPPDPKSVSGEDASTHDRGMGGPLAWLPLSVQPGEVLVQDVDREQELTSTAGLQSRGGGAELSLDRELRIVPSKPGLFEKRSACHQAGRVQSESLPCWAWHQQRQVRQCPVYFCQLW
ncbi:TPA: hypothetical protein ACH3X2_001210 [Trebouxia sp. C0005]